MAENRVSFRNVCISKVLEKERERVLIRARAKIWPWRDRFLTAVWGGGTGRGWKDFVMCHCLFYVLFYAIDFMYVMLLSF